MPTGKVHLVIDEATNIVTLSFSAPGETDVEHDAMALETRAFYEGLVARKPDGRFRVMVDLTNAGVPTKHATDIYIETLSDKRIERTSFFGLSSSIKSIISFIVNAAGRGDHVRFFIDKDQALAWLKEI